MNCSFPQYDERSSTGQVEEVGFLVELVEDGSRAVLYIGRSEDSDAVLGKGFGEIRTAVMVFESGDARSHWGNEGQKNRTCCPGESAMVP